MNRKNNAPFEANCCNCGRIFKTTACQRYKYRKNINTRLFCSKSCYHASEKGAGNPKWRGGKTISKGYVYIYVPSHPYAEHHGYVLEHRLVMESVLERYLKPEKSVHHIDGNTFNNEPENLMLMATEGEHRKLHLKYRTRQNGRIFGHQEGVTAYI